MRRTKLSSTTRALRLGYKCAYFAAIHRVVGSRVDGRTSIMHGLKRTSRLRGVGQA